MIELVADGVDAMTLAAANLRSDWQEFGWGEPDEPGPQTEDAVERGFRPHERVDDEQGRSESLAPDGVGDIADEGPGHRG